VKEIRARALLIGFVVVFLVSLAGPGTASARTDLAEARVVRTPDPAPQPTPRASSSSLAPGVLFDGDSVGSFAMNQSAPGAVQEIEDPTGEAGRVFDLTVHDSDVYPLTPTDNPRAQLLSPGIIEKGDEFWLGTKFMIPQGFPEVDGWMSLVSIYGPPFEGTGPWQVDVRGASLCWQRNEDSDWDIPWREPIRYGKWVSILLHERFATDGWVEMWIDGKPVTFFAGSETSNPDHHEPTERLHMATVDASNDGGPNAAKIMQYRQAGMFGVGSVYFGELKIATTREGAEVTD
jgi:hypothetical protein